MTKSCSPGTDALIRESRFHIRNIAIETAELIALNHPMVECVGLSSGKRQATFLQSFRHPVGDDKSQDPTPHHPAAAPLRYSTPYGH